MLISFQSGAWSATGLFLIFNRVCLLAIPVCLYELLLCLAVLYRVWVFGV